MGPRSVLSWFLMGNALEIMYSRKGPVAASAAQSFGSLGFHRGSVAMFAEKKA